MSAKSTRIHNETHPGSCLIQWVRLDAQTALQLVASLGPTPVPLVVTLEREFVNLVGKIVPIAVLLQVRHKIVDILCARAERTTGGEVNVADDLVDTYATRNIAAFACLVLQFLGPALSDTLLAASVRNTVTGLEDM